MFSSFWFEFVNHLNSDEPQKPHSIDPFHSNATGPNEHFALEPIVSKYKRNQKDIFRGKTITTVLMKPIQWNKQMAEREREGSDAMLLS